MPFYSRKPTRISDFDYTSDNYYFVTICTHEKKCIFGQPDQLNQFGQICKDDLNALSSHFENVKIDHSVVMPNHIHAIVVIGCEDAHGKRPNLNTVIGQFKSGVSRKIRKTEPDLQVWQRSYHDHIIRNRASYDKIWTYIETNSVRWNKDCFYREI